MIIQERTFITMGSSSADTIDPANTAVLANTVESLMIIVVVTPMNQLELGRREEEKKEREINKTGEKGWSATTWVGN